MSVIKKRYTKSEKMAIVLESQEDGVVIEDLAHRYAVHENTIRRWRKEYSVYNTNAFPGKGNEILTEEQREIKQLRKDLKEAQLANEILKKAMGIISSPNRKNLLS